MAAPVIDSLSTSSIARYSTNVDITIGGSNFTDDPDVPDDNSWANVLFEGSLITPDSSSNTAVTFTIPDTYLETSGYKTVAVRRTRNYPNPAGSSDSNEVSIHVFNPVPVISSLSINSRESFTAEVVVTVNGSKFVPQSKVQWGGVDQATTFVSTTQLQFTVTAAMLQSPGTFAVRVVTAEDTGGTSASLNFTIYHPVPIVSSSTPASATRGSAISVTLNGSKFRSSTVANVNGAARTTTYISDTQISFALTAGDVANAGTLQLSATTPDHTGGTSSSISFTVNNPVPTLTSVSPTSRTVGDGSFTLACTGTNFFPDSKVRVGGADRVTAYVSPTQLNATIPASDQSTAGNLSVTVFNPTPGGGTSGAQTLTINNPAPVASSLSPTSITKEAAQFTLTVNGSGFVSGATVRWNGANRTTTFVSASQLTAVINAADVAAAGTATVTVFNPTPGGGTSSGLTFTINNPIPTITSISPTTVTAGSGAFTLTVNGTNFVSGQSTVYWNGAARTTTFVSATQLTAAIAAADVGSAGTNYVTVVTAAPGGGTSNSAEFTVGTPNPVPTISSLSPTNKDAGSAQFTLTVNGTNFVPGSVVQWEGSNRTTTYVSATQLTAVIAAADVAVAGTFLVRVFNPAPGGGTSGNASFTVNALNPVPTISTISPASATAGSAQFTLTVDGANFISASKVRWNGADRTTTFVSSTRLTAIIPAADVTTAGTATVTVFTPTPGGGTSSGLTFTINAPANNPVPTLTSMSPSSATAGATDITVVLTGTGFYAGSQARWNGANRTTTYTSDTQISVAITTADLAGAGTFPITVFNAAPGGGTSNSLSFSVLSPTNPVPTITSLSPSSKLRGEGAFSMSVFGTGIIPSTTVQLDGAQRTPTYVNPTRVDAAILAADIATLPGTLSKINPRANPEFVSANAKFVRAISMGSALSPAVSVGSLESKTGLFAPEEGVVAVTANGVEAVEVTEDVTRILNTLEAVNGIAWSSLTGKPTTLSGYGITDAVPTSHAGTYGGAAILGVKNLWGGIYFGHRSYLMWNADKQGVYDTTASAWRWQWNEGTLDVGNIPWARLTSVPSSFASDWSTLASKPAWVSQISDPTGTYASLTLALRSGYAGFRVATSEMRFMIATSGEGGVFNEGVGWKWYFDSTGALTTGTIPWSRLTSVPSTFASDWSTLASKPSWTGDIVTRTGTYGTLNLVPYGGYIGMKYNGTLMTLMMDSVGNVGVHNETSSAWVWYVANGALQVGSVPWSLVSSKPTAITRIENQTGTYGSIDVRGTTNSYGGIHFPDSQVTLMMNPTYQGVMNDSGSWDWYFADGVLTAGTVPWANITGKPTTLAGYGITDGGEKDVHDVVTVDEDFTSSSFTNSTLSVPLDADGIYEVTAFLLWSPTGGSGLGALFKLNTGVTLSSVRMVSSWPTGSAGTDMESQGFVSSAAADPSITTALHSVNSSLYARFHGVMVKNASAGSVTVQVASSTNGANVRLQKGSFLKARKLN